MWQLLHESSTFITLLFCCCENADGKFILSNIFNSIWQKGFFTFIGTFYFERGRGDTHAHTQCNFCSAQMKLLTNRLFFKIFFNRNYTCMSARNKMKYGLNRSIFVSISLIHNVWSSVITVLTDIYRFTFRIQECRLSGQTDWHRETTVKSGFELTLTLSDLHLEWPWPCPLWPCLDLDPTACEQPRTKASFTRTTNGTVFCTV